MKVKLASKWRLEEAGRAGRNAVRQTGKADRQGILDWAGRKAGGKAGSHGSSTDRYVTVGVR